MFFAALAAACGGDSDDVEQAAPREEEGERAGPAGCYIEGERRCDCEIEEAACTEDVGIWVDMGCATCAS